MRPQQLYAHLYQKLAESWKSLPDKPDETPESTLLALWCLAAGLPLSSLRTAEDLPQLEKAAADQLAALVDRRLSGEPLAYLTGRQVFMGIEFLCSPKAMIPRKETEILSQAAINLARRLVSERGKIRALDVCTGSGNLALALAYHEVNCQVTGIDLSAEAIDLAQKNAAYLGLGDRVRFCQGDLFSPLEGEEGSAFLDLIICNPPYISSTQVDRLPAEIRHHEPRLALDGGPYGIRIITRLINEAPRFLKPDSWICFEVGSGQGNSIANMLRKRPAYNQVESFIDKTGEIRVLSAKTLPIE